MVKTGDAIVGTRSRDLASEFIGQGHGGSLLKRAVKTALAWGPSRVWLHTCTDAPPHALNDYLKSGFSIFKVENENADESSTDAG